MSNPAERLAKLPTHLAIAQLKEECTPKGEIQMQEDLRCNVEATDSVKDDWGDSCKGSKCCLTKGHSGNHMASDGANGWVYYK